MEAAADIWAGQQPEDCVIWLERHCSASRLGNMQREGRKSPLSRGKQRQWKTPSPKCARIEEAERRAHTEGGPIDLEQSLKSVRLEMRQRKLSQESRDFQLKRLLATCLEETAPTEEAKDHSEAPIPEGAEVSPPCCRLCIIA